jgi:TrmH family RNA methyltransferase
MISTSNPRIKLIRKLRDRKERQQTGLFYVEGLRIVAEALQTGAKIEFLVIAPGLLTSPFGKQLLQSEAARNIPIFEVSDETFLSFSNKDGPQGLGAVVKQKWANLDQVQKQAAIWTALDAVQDPGNLGTILRTSDAVGGAGVILLDQATDPFDPASVRASMGAVFSQHLIKASLQEFAASNKANHIPVVGTSGAAELDYHQARYPFPCILLMGSERHGLLDQHLRLCDMIVKIPMIGRSDSLNLAIATAIVLYELFNQHRF